jgi:CHAD domain-containing protein
MADDKWISGLHGDMPVTAAARRVLTVRLGVVLEWLPSAVEHADNDVEHVHQLRVSTRRAGAAMRLFGTSLPAKLDKKTRCTLRAIRRAAGSARDWDVFLEMLNARAERSDANGQPGLDFLLGFGHGQRVCAQEHLRQATDGSGERLSRQIALIAEALDAAEGTQTLRELAVPMLKQLLHEFEEAVAGDLRPYEALHQVRILGKQLRYAMELFESCFAPEFRAEVYPSVAEMQDILGRANDSHVALTRLDDLRARAERMQPAQWPRYRTAFARLSQYHRRRLPEQRRQFTKWWTVWQSSGHAAELGKLLRSES